MAFNQIPNQNQAVNSPPLPLIPNSQMMNSDDHVNQQLPQQQQPDQPDHVNPFPNPNNQAPPNSTNDLLREFSQFSEGLRNQRERLSLNLMFQHFETVNSVMFEHLNRDMLVENYVSNLLLLLREKENELVTTNHAYFELESQLQALQLAAAEKEATVAQLNQQLQMINNEPGEASSCSSTGDLKDRVDFNCRMCGKEISCVLIFPCKHLCCCKECEAYVYSCPVCTTVKESSVEVSWPVMKKQGADQQE